MPVCVQPHSTMYVTLSQRGFLHQAHQIQNTHTRTLSTFESEQLLTSLRKQSSTLKRFLIALYWLLWRHTTVWLLLQHATVCTSTHKSAHTGLGPRHTSQAHSAPLPCNQWHIDTCNTSDTTGPFRHTIPACYSALKVASNVYLLYCTVVGYLAQYVHTALSNAPVLAHHVIEQLSNSRREMQACRPLTFAEPPRGQCLTLPSHS